MPSSRRMRSKDVILWRHLLGVGRPCLQFSPSFVPASLLFSLALPQRGPDAALLGSSCGGNLSSWACAFVLLYSTRQRVHAGGGCGKFHASRLSHRATIRLAHSSARRTRARAAPDRAPAALPRAARRWSRVQCASLRFWPQPISGADRVRDASLFLCARQILLPALHHAFVHCRANNAAPDLIYHPKVR